MMNVLPKKPYARIHLPALTPEEALLISNIFVKVSDAIWRAHGHAMAAFLEYQYGEDMPSDAGPEEPDQSEEPDEGDTSEPWTSGPPF